jgi:hypothetical protein
MRRRVFPEAALCRPVKSGSSDVFRLPCRRSIADQPSFSAGGLVPSLPMQALPVQTVWKACYRSVKSQCAASWNLPENPLCVAQILLDFYVAVHIFRPSDETPPAASGPAKLGKSKMTAFDIQGFGKENIDVALKSVDAVTKGMQAMAVEAVDYSKRSLDASGAAVEKLLAVKSLDSAVAVQSEIVRSAYEDYVGQMTRMGEIATDMAKSAYQPYEAFFGKFGK